MADSLVWLPRTQGIQAMCSSVKSHSLSFNSLLQHLPYFYISIIHPTEIRVYALHMRDPGMIPQLGFILRANHKHRTGTVLSITRCCKIKISMSRWDLPRHCVSQLYAAGLMKQGSSGETIPCESKDSLDTLYSLACFTSWLLSVCALSLSLPCSLSPSPKP